MSEDEIKKLIQTELEESGYMYTLGMLKGTTGRKSSYGYYKE